MPPRDHGIETLNLLTIFVMGSGEGGGGRELADERICVKHCLLRESARQEISG